MAHPSSSLLPSATSNPVKPVQYRQPNTQTLPVRNTLFARFLAVALGISIGTPGLISSSLDKSITGTLVVAANKTPAPHPKLARLGKKPDWSTLDKYQRTITRAEFQRLLDHCYTRSGADYKGLIQVFEDRARIIKQSNHPEGGWYELHFLTDRRKTKEIERDWTAPWQMEKLPRNENQPLKGIHIAIDPGHIGGEWADIEGRKYTIGEDTIPVQEGEMTLKVAKILQRDLTSLGAKITLTRTTEEPVTKLRTEDLTKEARLWLLENKGLAPDSLVEATARRMFYVSSEIRERAVLVNEEIKPDLALCLHFDASPWKNPYKPAFRDVNHLHLLINGCYSYGEVSEDDTRIEMLERILQRVYYYELRMAEEIANSMARETRLPPFSYNGSSGKSVNSNPYVWSRNLLANRKFMCPVVFFEPYCMNNKEVHSRVQTGEYRGLKEFGGIYKKNIFQEYADGVTTGLVNYFRKVR